MLFKKSHLAIFLFVIGTILSNCTVQKRSYRSGYYVSWNKKSNSASKVSKQVIVKKTEALANRPVEPAGIKQPGKQEPLLVSAQKLNVIEVKSRLVKSLTLLKDSCGDLITLKDGEEINVKVVEVSPTVIKYKRCDNLEGPTVVVSLKSVFMIKYLNGTKEIFKKEADNQTGPEAFQQAVEKPINAKKYNAMAIASLSTFILYFTIVLAPVPLVFGLIALHQMKKHPEKYKGKWMAVIGVIPGIAALFILLLAFLFALAL